MTASAGDPWSDTHEELLIAIMDSNCVRDAALIAGIDIARAFEILRSIEVRFRLLALRKAVEAAMAENPEGGRLPEAPAPATPDPSLRTSRPAGNVINLAAFRR